MRKIKLATIILFVVIICTTITACGNSSVCDNCDKKFSGTAYYARNLDDTLCKDCAWKYWNPLPIENYKKK